MNKIVLIKKYSPTSIFWLNLLKYKAIAELSTEEIINKYQGFEGTLVALFYINEDKSNFKKIKKRCFEIEKVNNCVLLYLISNDQTAPFSLNNEAPLVGYDVGVCEEEKTIYSSIFNEILFGHLDELINFKKFLNQNLLFPSKSVAEKYVNLHNELSAQGKGVEDYEEMIIYEVWKFSDLKETTFTVLEEKIDSPQDNFPRRYDV